MTPFADGYIAAARASLPPEHRDAPLAPATLAAMLKDCEAMTSPPHVFRYDKETGMKNWHMRQEGWPFYSGGPSLREQFPPLTLYLADDGLIYQREAGQ